MRLLRRFLGDRRKNPESHRRWRHSVSSQRADLVDHEVDGDQRKRQSHGSGSPGMPGQENPRTEGSRCATAQYKKPAHYEFLARAYLDLKKCMDAAEACERAEEMRLAELK